MAGNVEGVRAAHAKRQRIEGSVRSRDVSTAQKGGGGDDGEGGALGAGELPEHCPVTPLGKLGRTFYYLDANQQLTELDAAEHTHLNFRAIFGTQMAFLYKQWPRLNKDGHLVGFKPELVAEALMAEAARRGVWNVLGRVRGAGAWLGEHGELVMHCGDGIVRSGNPIDGAPVLIDRRLNYENPGSFGHYVYPTAPALPRPAERLQPSGGRGPGERLLAMLQTWNFARGFDAMILFGWIAIALLGAAVRWRGVVWTTGDKGTGKSTLHEIIAGIMGGEQAMLTLHEPSQAAVYQLVGHSTLPVGTDEAEAEEDNRKLTALVKLARWSASGARIARGGQDGKPIDFTIRCAFLFTSILVPPLGTQDRSRIALLELKPLARDKKPPSLDPAELGELGRAVRRRLVDQWPRWGATLALYRDALQEQGHSSRSADQWGSFLAAADLVMHDELPDADTLKGWAFKLRLEALAEVEEDAPDHEACVHHLRTSMVDIYRHGRPASVLEVVREAAGVSPDGNEFAATQTADAMLLLFGLKLHSDAVGKKWLAVANSHSGLQKLYAGSRWGSRAGTVGVWVQAMRRIPGAQRANLRFGGAGMRCTLVPLEAVMTPG